MFPAQTPGINPGEFSRCEDLRRVTDPGKSLSPIQKMDLALKESIHHAFWKDDVLRAIEYDAVDVHVNEGIVHLYGHIVSTTSQSRIMNAIRAVPGIASLQNHLVLDDQLTLEVAASLGDLEHLYDCKFFTGASHGVISMDGVVRDDAVKLLAEKQAAASPQVRGVINHVRVKGSKPWSQTQPFLQPTVGETIYFQGGASGIVRQVIINPNNRRVTAMVIRGDFNGQRTETHSHRDGKTVPSESHIVVPIKTVRYLTKVSGFLHINSSERDQYQDYDPASYFSPSSDWTPPYPYCPEQVLFLIEQQNQEIHSLGQVSQPQYTVVQKEQLLSEQLLANDSLGG